jgi:hypothetical protein
MFGRAAKQGGRVLRKAVTIVQAVVLRPAGFGRLSWPLSRCRQVGLLPGNIYSPDPFLGVPSLGKPAGLSVLLDRDGGFAGVAILEALDGPGVAIASRLG